MNPQAMTTDLRQTRIRSGLEAANIAGLGVDAVTPERIVEWAVTAAQAGQSQVCCFATVHMVIEAHRSGQYARMLAAADRVAPDGLPLVWVQHLYGVRNSRRTAGPDTAPLLWERCAREGLPVALYGATSETLGRLRDALRQRFPDLQVVYAYAPPFRPLTPDEDEQIVRDLTASGARMVFVALGCPKQEIWCIEHRGRIPAVLLPVGAAFDFHAGTLRRAPVWLQRLGLEWLHRLAQEPRRLARRYFIYNTWFVLLVAMQWLGLRSFAPAPPWDTATSSQETSA
ncbi:MAG: WecB/TagA/CpsF family glycosyltransferase [Candidatus Sumerlaeaceae bacterium]|nr:WecB/TagA/CpsF family glycosyltransferase [Candidatus Sumerlaeaceae bacterium]